jgi:hypothetical protein
MHCRRNCRGREANRLTREQHGETPSLRAGSAARPTERKATAMGRIIKALFLLALIGFAGVVGYAYLGDLQPAQTEVTKPVVLNAD